MENSYTTPTIGVSQNKTQLFLIIGLIVALLIGFIAVFQAIRLQNRANEVATPSDQLCKVALGHCTISNEDILSLKGLTDEQKSGLELVARNDFTQEKVATSGNIFTHLRNSKNEVEITFDTEPNRSYTCDIEKNGQKLTDEDKKTLCPLPASAQPSNILSCTPPTATPTHTPTATPTNSPTPEDCKDCIDGKFLCQETLTDKKAPGQAGPDGTSCPSLSYWNINYEAPKNSCPLLTPPPVLNGLECDKHVVKVVPFGGGNPRTLSPKECLDLKKTGPQGFVLRLHSGNKAGCINYDIKAYDENGEEMTRICENCTMLSGCPSSCAEFTKGNGEALPISEAIDLPPITNSDLPVQNECIPPFQNPDTNSVTACDFSIVGNACRPFSDPNQLEFDVTAEGYASYGMYFDDQYSGEKNDIIVPEGRSTQTHKYINSGHFNVVLYCEGGGQRHVCVKRISLTCGENKCVQIAPPKLDFSKCQDCTPTRSPCDPTTDPSCGGPNPTSVTTN